MGYVIDHDPNDLSEMLSALRKDESNGIRLLAQAGLTKEGDETAQENLATIIQSWGKADLPDRKRRGLSDEMELVCGLIAELKLSWLEADLRITLHSLEKRNQAFVIDALAGLGDANALKQLHEMVESEDVEVRMAALKMCGHLDEEKSHRFVKDIAESSKDPLILVAQQIRQHLRQGIQRKMANAKSAGRRRTD